MTTTTLSKTYNIDWRLKFTNWLIFENPIKKPNEHEYTTNHRGDYLSALSFWMYHQDKVVEKLLIIIKL